MPSFPPLIWVTRCELPHELAERIKHLCTLHYLREHRPVRYVVSHRYPDFDDPWLDGTREIRHFPQLSVWRWTTTRYFRWRAARLVRSHPSAHVVVRHLKTARSLVEHARGRLWLEVIHPDRAVPFVREADLALAGILVQTEGIRDRIRDRTDYPHDRLHLSRSGAELVDAPVEALAPRRTWLYCGSLQPEKNVDFLFRVAEAVRETVDVRIVGGDPERFDELVSSHGGHPTNVTHRERVPHRELEGELKRAELVLSAPVMSRFNRLYTSPMKVYQALLADRPVITLRRPALEELGCNVEHGLLLADDHADFLDRCRQLADRPKHVRDLIGRMRREDKHHMTWKARADRIHGIVRRTDITPARGV